MRIEFAKKILLTGAGFTKNFGGFLAREMWSKIFNHPKIQSRQHLRKLLMEDYDYESVYSKVLGGDYTDDEKNAIDTAIFETYEALDKIAQEWTFRSDAPYPVNIYGVNKFIERFAGERDQMGFFFTINQDLFIERRFSSTKTMLVHPGVRKIPDAHKIISRLPLEREDFIQLPTNKEMESNRVNPLSTTTLHYVKLHGSFGWKSSDGANRLVIGRDKEKQITEEPLLTWYFELFRKLLLHEKRCLFVIGYGFGDHHINKVIGESARLYGLKLYVLSPSEQSKFINNLRTLNDGEEILSALSGYFPYSLLDLFPSDQSESHAWREIEDRYFADGD
jgi:hypothetical protein